ncbi:sulfonate transport system ATP-binding protein [Aureimonas altamirensis DSM 21988]|uniref:Sulfonate transport system ATP-binding protein n=1 Tax=Aureimonas altamirensis DSM 21988 TaxID=1121026 RepID=A0ABY1IEG6_9HYPH|nr:ABC transporter ATP-binding protein [Aureimonas altamirensis]SHJ05441.1 sulfonate transport system ATP-binding protein [Aureimonas altamirensis DSM 21988]
MLSIEQLSKVYPNGTTALAGLDLDVAEGEIVAIVGGSGCGKSTLLRLISGLDGASRGAVRLMGNAVTRPVEEIGMVFQEPRLLPWLTVADNVGFGLRHLPAGQRRARVSALLDAVQLGSYAQRWPKELSGGQAQRVAIARALAPEPSVLLMDEPFSALDAITRTELQDHLVALWQRDKRTFIIVTHDIDEAVALANRVLVMRSHPGRVSAEIAIDVPRPRQRISPQFEAAVRRVRLALDEAIGRPH